MKRTSIRKMVFAAFMAALVCVATMVVEIPSPTNGYVNLGDCFVLLSAWLLGPWYGAAAAGIGSMLTDLFMGYAYYAPGTLVIKGLMGLCAALLYRALHKTAPKGALILSSVVAEVIMVVGYFVYAAFCLGYGFVAGAAGIPGNLVQAVVGIAAAIVLMSALRRTGIDKKLL